MSDSTILRLRRSLVSEPSIEGWLSLEAALLRYGYNAEEVFEPLQALYATRLQDAIDARRALEVEQDALTQERYQRALEEAGADLVCARCEGRGFCEVPRHQQRWGDGDDWRRNEPFACPSCRPATDVWIDGKIVHQYRHPVQVELIRRPDRALRNATGFEVRNLFEARLDQAHDDEQAALDDLRPFVQAQELTKGALVEYTNTRARARFTGNAHDPARVPVGTRGHVFWVSPEGDRVGVSAGGDRSFFTVIKNLSQPLNRYERLRGLDPETRKQDAKRLQLSSDEPKLLEVFGTTHPSRGQRCVLAGSEGEVFWTGACKNSGRLRIGIKARGETIWGFASDAERVA
jgi:hypothetical protein